MDPENIRSALGRNLTYGMYDALGRAIVTGAFDTTPFPTEAELSKQHGVSRSVTREAVKMLTSKGLLSARPRQGTIVQPSSTWNLLDSDVLHWLLDRKFSLTLLRQFTELRLSVEPGAAALAAKAADTESIAAIEAGFRRMCAAEIGDDDPLGADIEFHLAILSASRNPFFDQLRDMISTALRTSIRLTNRFKGRTASLPEHEAVMNAIVAHDSVVASTAMQSLITNVMGLIEAAEAQDEA